MKFREEFLVHGLGETGNRCLSIESDDLFQIGETSRTVRAFFQVFFDLPAFWRIQLLVQILTDKFCRFTAANGFYVLHFHVSMYS